MAAQVRIGTSFSPHRASFLGLDPRATFEAVLGLDLGLIRLSAYWDEIRGKGYSELDWMLETAAAAGRPILLTVGMKGIQWPEFYLPADQVPKTAGRGACLGSDPGLREAVVGFVGETVARYQDRAGIVAWQVENEPFNKSGPNKWWIDPTLIEQEVAVVRALDSRPIVLNTFAHFDLLNDWFSRPHRNLLDLAGEVPEEEALRAVRAADVLGLDIYTHIGVAILGFEIVRTAAPDWAQSAQRWLQAAAAEGKEAWIIECQAEPWEPTKDTYAEPKSLTPEEIAGIYGHLAAAGFTTILLWGCEYWLWRAGTGDSRWLDAVNGLLGKPG
jgi:hypothetical protein